MPGSTFALCNAHKTRCPAVHLHCAMHTKQDAWQYICTVQCTQNKMPGSTFALCNAHKTRCLAVHLHCAMHTKQDAWQYICTVQWTQNKMPGSTFALCNAHKTRCLAVHLHCAMHTKQNAWRYICTVQSARNEIFLLSLLLISVSIILTKHCKQQHSIPYIAIINDGNNSIVSEKMSMYLWRSISTLYLHARQARATIGDSGLCHVPLAEFMYLVFTRTPGESYRRRLRSLLLCLCEVFRALINSLVCRYWMLTRRKSYCRRLRSLCLCDVFRALINSIVYRYLRRV